MADKPTSVEHTPIGEAEFADLMAALEVSGPIAVAVSGGGDSMALSLLVARLMDDARYVTFDHGLRDGSAEEAKKVGQWLGARGLDHTILTWRGEDKPTSNIQEAARLARYEAMESWCAENGIQTLLVAHHLEDQAETFLLRLARGSGVDGLAAMQPRSSSLVLDAVRDSGPDIVRPLLAVPKSRLLATLAEMDQEWIEDPLNRDEAFSRVQARGLLSEAPMEGLNAERLAATAKRMGRVRGLLDRMTNELLRSAVQQMPGGYARLDLAQLSAAEEEIALRALSRLLVHYSGGTFPPRLSPLERLFQDIKTEGFAGATLSGCQISVSREGRLCLGREEAAIGSDITVASGDCQRWDNRYWIRNRLENASLEVQKLGVDGWKELVELWPDVADLELPVAFRAGLAAGRVNGRLVFVGETDFAQPGFEQEDCAFQPRRELFG